MQIAYKISAINLKGADMMANTTNFSVRMDSDIKKQCETLYNELGINWCGIKKVDSLFSRIS